MDIRYIGYVLFFELSRIGCWIWIWGQRHPTSYEYKGDGNEYQFSNPKTLTIFSTYKSCSLSFVPECCWVKTAHCSSWMRILLRGNERERKTNREMKHTNILKYVFDILFFTENHFKCFVTFEEIIHNSLVIRIHTTLFFTNNSG